MPPQAVFAATCHVTPLATAPDRRNTVRGAGPKRVRQLRTWSPRPNLATPKPASCSRNAEAPASRTPRPSPGTAPRMPARC